MSSRVWVIVALMGLVSAPVSSQDSVSTGRLTVMSNVPGAVVFVDSVRVGSVPVQDFAVQAGVRTVCVVAPGAEYWAAPSRCENVDIRTGGGAELFLDLPYGFRIMSEPFGAEVRAGDSVLGQTPFVFLARNPPGVVTLRKEGYDDLTLVLTVSDPFVYGMLNPKNRADYSSIYLVREEPNSVLPIVLSASSAVVSGAAAAYLKIHADNLYSDYRATGNTANLERVKQLDVASGIALGISQLSLAVLSYLLLSR